MGGVFALLMALLIIWWVGRFFSSPLSGKQVATLLDVSDRGTVSVRISGETVAQRAESGLRLYDGDRVETGW